MIPPLVLELAHEARRFGATVLVRECGHGAKHVDVFDVPDLMQVRLWDAGFHASEWRADYWHWCETDADRITTPALPG